ncbi:MAG: hypothetical protein LE178_01655 [Endomicrobium sp.]|nr:hypothetical protein [Endomicrobium sp.]
MSDLLFEDVKKQIVKKFVESGWITVYGNFDDGCVYPAIVDDDKVAESLKNFDWDNDIHPSTPCFQGKKYVRFPWKKGFEPLVHILPSPYFSRYSWLELSEEFRFLYSLREVHKSDEEKTYLYSRSDGDEEEAAKITNKNVQIKLKFLKDYISARKKQLFIYFMFTRTSEKTVSELGIKKMLSEDSRRHSKDYSSSEFIYNHTIVCNRETGAAGTFSQIRGKVLVERNKRHEFIEKKNYEKFIYDIDENGKDKLSSCNPADNVSSIAKIFFKPEVLQKYFDEPSKYEVKDGYILRNNRLMLKVDNNCEDYVIVCLRELGLLHHKEQLHWKSYNIPRPQKGGFSSSGYSRFVEEKFSEPDNPDFILKNKYERFNKSWHEKYNWYLFIPLNKNDEHCLKSFHSSAIENDNKKFCEQVLFLSKIFIDSLNEKKLFEGTHAQEKDFKGKEIKGIGKFELFLVSENAPHRDDIIDFLRNLQKLRSTRCAHVGGDDKILRYFGDKGDSLQNILQNIVFNLIIMMDWLEVLLLKFK